MSSKALSQSSTIVANDDCLSTKLDGESVILHMGNGKYYGFNDVGTYIWELVQNPHTIQEVCDSISKQYDVSEQQCRDDVIELGQEMIKKDLVKIVEQ